MTLCGRLLLGCALLSFSFAASVQAQQTDAGAAGGCEPASVIDQSRSRSAGAGTAALEPGTGGCGPDSTASSWSGITISSTSFPASRMCRHAQARRVRTSARSRRTSRSARTRRISRGSGCTPAMHRTNILDPQMNVIGIALIHNRGEVWAVEDFAHAVEGLGPSEIEGRVIGLLAQQGIEQYDGNRGCAADLRDVAWECGRIAPALHHALGGLRPEPSAGCSGEQAAAAGSIVLPRWASAIVAIRARDSPLIRWQCCSTSNGLHRLGCRNHAARDSCTRVSRWIGHHVVGLLVNDD